MPNKLTKKNILILSCGTRNKVVQGFKKLKYVDKVICTDSSPYAPALYEGDIGIIVPRITEENYLDIILSICSEYHIDGLLSLIDPELSIIAENKDEFLKINCVPMISDQRAINNCFDKNSFAKVLKEHNLTTIPSCSTVKRAKIGLNSGELQYPLMLKPAKGSASIGLNKIHNLAELQKFDNVEKELIIQEWIEFQEYGVDCYIDLLTGKLVDIFIKQKLKMRAGETDKAISIHNSLIKETIINFLENYPYQFYGVIDFDVFCNDEICLVSEVNPRFGGGYPHAHAAGLDYPKYFLNNLNNIPNQPFDDYSYEEGIIMMKYNEIMIKNQTNLLNNN